MRALILVHTFPSRTQTFVLNQVVGLLRLGCDVRVLAKESDFPDPTWAPPEIAAAGLFDRITYLRHRGRRGLAGLLGEALSLAGYGLRHPLRARRALGVAVRTGDFSALQGLLAARALAEQGPFDVMHCQFGSIANMAVMLDRAGIVRAPIVASFRGSDLTSYVRRRPRAYRLLAAIVARALPVCTPFAASLAALGMAPERIEVHFSGVDTARFPFRERKAPAGRPLRLAAIGRMTAKKGFRHLIDAVRILRESGRSVVLTLAGDGPELQSLERQVERASLESIVRFEAWVPHERIAAFLNEHDLLVAPSVTDPSGDREGIPNVLKEAMACGLPVIASRHSGIPDLIEDGAQGFLVPEGDPCAVADRIAALADNPALWPTLSAAARHRIERLFDRDALNTRLLEIYREVAAEASAGRRTSGRQRRLPRQLSRRRAADSP